MYGSTHKKSDTPDWLQVVKQHAAATVGWGVFLGLLAALFVDRYFFNPFTFGFAYYTIYAISRIANKDDKKDVELLTQRIMAVGAIALIGLWINLRKEVDTNQFIRSFERTCYHSREPLHYAASKICDEIKSHLNDTLEREAEFGDE